MPDILNFDYSRGSQTTAHLQSQRGTAGNHGGEHPPTATLAHSPPLQGSDAIAHSDSSTSSDREKFVALFGARLDRSSQGYAEFLARDKKNPTTASTMQFWKNELKELEELSAFRRDLGVEDLSARIEELRGYRDCNISPASYLRLRSAKATRSSADKAHLKRMEPFADDRDYTRMIARATEHRDAYSKALARTTAHVQLSSLPDAFAHATDRHVPYAEMHYVPTHPAYRYNYTLGNEGSAVFAPVYHAPEIDRQPLHMVQSNDGRDLDCGYYTYNTIAAATGREVLPKSEFHRRRDIGRGIHLHESGEAHGTETTNPLTGLDELSALLNHSNTQPPVRMIADPSAVLASSAHARSLDAMELNHAHAVALTRARVIGILAKDHWTTLLARTNSDGFRPWAHVDSLNGHSLSTTYHAANAVDALKIYISTKATSQGKSLRTTTELGREVDGLIIVS